MSARNFFGLAVVSVVAAHLTPALALDFDPSPQVGPAPLSLAQVLPPNALAGTSPLLQLLGTGFETGCAVFLGTEPCSDVRVAGDESIYCQAPKDLVVGRLDVTVRCNSSQRTLTQGFLNYAAMVLDPGAPKAFYSPSQSSLRILGGAAPFQLKTTASWDPNNADCAIGANTGVITCSTPSGASYQSYSFTVQDSIGNTVTAGVPIISHLASTGVQYLPVNGSSALNYAPLSGGLAPYQYAVTSGEGTIAPYSQTLSVGPDTGKVMVAVTDSMGERATWEVQVFKSGAIDPSFTRYEGGAPSDGFGPMTYNLPLNMLATGAYLYVPSFLSLGITRLSLNGVLDSSFGDKGTATSTLNSSLEGNGTKAVAMSSDGKLWMVGDAYQDSWFPPSRGNGMLVSRFLADGTPDPSFAGDNSGKAPGSVFFGRTGRSMQAQGFALLSDGSAAVLERSCDDKQACQYTIYKVSADGRSQTAFDLGASSGPSTSGFSFQMASDGGAGVYVASYQNWQLSIAHYSQLGIKDTAWGSQLPMPGMVGTTGECELASLATSDARIFVSWSCVIQAPNPSNSSELSGEMFTRSTGQVDPAWGAKGMLEGGPYTIVSRSSAIFQADGKLLLTYASNGTNVYQSLTSGMPHATMIRFTASDGSVDPEFGDADLNTISNSDMVIATDGARIYRLNHFAEVWACTR